MAMSESTAVLRLLHHLTDLVVELQGQVDSLAPGDCFLSRREGADFLGISVRTLGEHVSELRHYKLPSGRVYFLKSDLARFMSQFAIQPGLSEQRELQELARKTMAKLHEA